MNPVNPNAPPTKPSTLIAILTDLHLWVPVVVLVLGTALLMTLR